MLCDEPASPAAGPAWEPIDDFPHNLLVTGSNYVEWIWSLLDDGIEVDGTASFLSLRTSTGDQLLAEWAARHLDSEMARAREAAKQHGHDISDVVMCCRASDLDLDAVSDDLVTQYASNPASALARAKAIGEICDVAEDLNAEAMKFKLSLARDQNLPRAIREALNGPPDCSRLDPGD